MKKIVLRDGFTAEEIPDSVWAAMQGKSYKDNDSIGRDDLAYLKVRFYDFDHAVRDGELVVSRKLAGEVLEIFAELFDAEYEIEKMILPDEYDADDDRIMADNNCSCFNYRVVDGTQTISAHGYGRAIDINPRYNPYIVGDKVMPPNGAEFADRSKDFAHKIDENDVCFKVFRAHGWRWGGNWNTQKDYQHFYKERKSAVRTLVRLIKK